MTSRKVKQKYLQKKKKTCHAVKKDSSGTKIKDLMFIIILSHGYSSSREE